MHTTTKTPGPLRSPEAETKHQQDNLPASVTFFMTSAERSALLRRLRKRDAGDRTAALLTALGVRKGAR